MALSGETSRFLYSGGSGIQADPDESIGGNRPIINTFNQIAQSAPYAQATLDAASTSLNILSASTNEAPRTEVAAVGDWVTVLNGAGAPTNAKILAVDGSSNLTIDREMPGLPALGDYIRFVKAENLFPNVTAAQASAGLVDHRMVYYLKHSSAGEANFKFWIDALTSGPGLIEIMGSGDFVTSTNYMKLAAGTDDPFNQWGGVDYFGTGSTIMWNPSELLGTRYGESMATPLAATSTDVNATAAAPVWLRRTIPPGSTGGTQAFALMLKSDDDVSPDPDPFKSGFIFSYDVAELTYTTTIKIDRKVYLGRSAKVTGTIVDEFGLPVVGLNAWIEVLSGPGSVATDLDGRTDASGQITSVYTAPSVLSTDPVLQVVIPTNPEV